MMFQDPESQFIGMSVEEEVVFGPENLGLPREEIERRMVWALKVVGMEGMLDRLLTNSQEVRNSASQSPQP